MKPIELWNELIKDNSVCIRDNKEYIIPKNSIFIKNKGSVEYLEKVSNTDVYIKCTDIKTIDVTNDHVFTLKDNSDKHAENLCLGDTIFDEYVVSRINPYKENKDSYDVTTETSHFMVNGLYSHNCRSFLTTEGKYVDWDGKIKSASENFYGRNNNGVVTINLPYVALESRGNIEEFWKILEDRLELCYRALVERYKALKGTRAKVAPILWMYGGLARKNAEDPIDDLITGFRCTYSLGYAGLWETVYYMTGKTLIENKDFALDILKFFKKKHEEWHTRLMDNNNPNSFLNTSTYGTPEEQTTTKFANALKTQFGYVEGVTDHDYVTNSYHINPAQPIDAFSKISFESEFQGLSTGGAISYVELPNMDNNLEALEEVVEYMYDTILYAECNVKRDTCAVCGYNGVISLIKENGKYLWECPNCRNRDTNKMSILRRICGYIGDASTGTSQGRLADIADRVLHL